MKEFDTRKKAKDNAEHITPELLRDFLKERVLSNVNNDLLNVLEPAVGSGQLLFNLKDSIAHIEAFDVNNEALCIAKQNFGDKITTNNEDFITADIKKQYDIAIANYPFSLKPTDAQKDFIRKSTYLKTFFDKQIVKQLFDPEIKQKDITGVLDFIFILKSFEFATQGFYLAFLGIGYRQQEEKFRRHLIDNKLIKEVGVLHNCKFEHTTISILYLHLTKTTNENPKSFYLDFKTNEYLEENATFENYQFTYPQPEIVKEVYDPVQLEIDARNRLKSMIEKELTLSKKIYELDPKLQEKLSNIEEYKAHLIDTIKNFNTV